MAAAKTEAVRRAATLTAEIEFSGTRMTTSQLSDTRSASHHCTGLGGDDTGSDQVRQVGV
jgi:hypothetical protein